MESMEGFKAIWRNHDLRLVTGLYAVQTIVAGASVVFVVEMAVQMTPFGSAGVGFLRQLLRRRGAPGRARGESGGRRWASSAPTTAWRSSSGPCPCS